MTAAELHPPTESPQDRPTDRITGLDFIRGVAILLVLCRHLHLPQTDSESSYLHHFLIVLQNGGWCGVDLFFVLSGFLVSKILFQQYQTNGKIHVGEFLVRRGFKIYPAFWIMLEATILYNILAGGTTAVKPLWIELCFLQNYFKGMYGHTWSLAVEEHCYLGLAILCVLLTRFRPNSPNPFRFIPFLAVLGALTAGWMRFQLSSHLETNGPGSILFPTHLRFDGFLVGTAMAYLACFHQSGFAQLCHLGRPLWITLGGLLLLPVFLFDVQHDPIVVRAFLTTNICVACCWILAAYAIAAVRTETARRPTRPLANAFARPIAFIGEHSYSIYLWHDLLEHAILRPLLGLRGSSPVPQVELWAPLYLATTLSGGIALSYVIERPALRIRDRWCRSSRNEPITPGERPAQAGCS